MRSPFGWLLPFQRIASALERLVELYEADLKARRVVYEHAIFAPDAISYQDDGILADLEVRRLDWLRRGGRPLEDGEEPPG